MEGASGFGMQDWSARRLVLTHEPHAGQACPVRHVTQASVVPYEEPSKVHPESPADRGRGEGRWPQHPTYRTRRMAAQTTRETGTAHQTARRYREWLPQSGLDRAQKGHSETARASRRHDVQATLGLGPVSGMNEHHSHVYCKAVDGWQLLLQRAWKNACQAVADAPA